MVFAGDHAIVHGECILADSRYDLIVLGGGPGGYVAAIRAAQLGMKAAVVEREHLGGICLNWGCIPTKALLRAAEIRHLLDHAADFGISAGDSSVDLQAVVKRSRKVAMRLNRGIGHLLRKNDVDVIMGEGMLVGSGTLRVRDEEKNESDYSAEHIVLATGARARSLPGIEPDGEGIWTYREAMVPEVLPDSLLVVGAGAIGIEFASFYSDLGTKVTVVEALDRILPVEDAEISALAHEAFEKQGMSIHVGAKLHGLRTGANGVEVTVELSDESRLEAAFDKVILAVGITGNVENIGIEGTRVVVERSHVVVNPWLETGEPGVYAIGDLVGPPWLAHKASHEAVICVDRIAGRDVHPLDVSRIPACTYCRPQVASIGLTEEKAREAGHDVRIGRFPFAGNGKAIVLGDSQGLIKTVFDNVTGELLGAHMIGSEVTELIQGYAIARTLEATEAQLIETVFPHPTLSEMMHESVLDAYGRAIHF